MAHESHRKQYFWIFVWLTVFTALEVGLVYLPISRTLMIVGLVGMAIAKGALVMNYYMHLGSETASLRRSIYYVLGIPAVYAMVLIAEAGWRML